jgi:hypothetical protein
LQTAGGGGAANSETTNRDNPAEFVKYLSTFLFSNEIITRFLLEKNPLSNSFVLFICSKKLLWHFL